MFKLLQLEIRKHQLWHYIKGVLIANLCFLSLFVLIYIMETREGNVPFVSYEMVFVIIDSVVRPTFIVFAAVLISRIFLEEYKTNAISVLFMYPIQRQKLMLAKVIIIIIFTFTTIFFSNLLIAGIFYLADRLLHFQMNPLTLVQWREQLLIIWIHASASAGIALIPLYIGMLRKSVPAALVSAILIVVLTSFTSSDFSLFSVTMIPVSLAMIGLLSAYLTIRRVDKADIL